jgi:hypothetical protein
METDYLESAYFSNRNGLKPHRIVTLVQNFLMLYLLQLPGGTLAGP